MFCGRSSSGRARPCQGRGSEFEPRRPLQNNTIRQGGVFLHLPAGQRLEQGTSEARETCRGHVLVPACVWRPGWAASEPRRPLQKNTTHQGGVFCIYRAAGDVLTVMQAAQKRRIATTLLSCSEDGARERYSIICCTFSFSLQPLCQWLHRR